MKRLLSTAAIVLVGAAVPASALASPIAYRVKAASLTVLWRATSASEDLVYRGRSRMGMTARTGGGTLEAGVGMLLVDFKGHSGWSESVDGVDGGPLICKDGLDEEFTGELGFAVVGGRTKATLPVPAGLGRGDCAAPVDAAFTATRPLAPHALARRRVGLTLKGRSSFDLSQSGWDGKMSARYLLRIVLVRVR